MYATGMRSYLHTDVAQAVGHIPLIYKKNQMYFISECPQISWRSQRESAFYLFEMVCPYIHTSMEVHRSRKTWGVGTESTHNNAGLDRIDAAIQNWMRAMLTSASKKLFQAFCWNSILGYRNHRRTGYIYQYDIKCFLSTLIQSQICFY